MSDAEEISALIEAMRSGDENRLIEASVALGQFGIPAINGLLITLQDDRHLVRDYSAMALGLMGAEAKSALPALCYATGDENDGVRYSAIVALGRIGEVTPKVSACLRASLDDSDEMVRKGARNALAELKLE